MPTTRPQGSWLDLVDRAQALQAIFGPAVPALEGVSLHEVGLHRDGPSLTLRFDLAAYPDPAPPKWRAAAHNTVQVRLVLAGVTAVEVDGFATTLQGDLTLVRAPDGQVVVSFAAEGCAIRCTARFPRIDAVTAYTDASRAN